MVEFKVIEVGIVASKELGSPSFKVAPQREDILLLDREGAEHAFEVVAVMHSIQPTTNAGDLLIRHLGERTEFLAKFTAGDSLPAAFGKYGS